jgi:hypothetical protein
VSSTILFAGAALAGTVTLSSGFGAAVVAAPFGDIDLAADNRLHPVRRSLMIEILGDEKVAVIRHSHGGHGAPGGLFRKLLDLTGAIEKAVIGVQMQMYESRRRWHRLRYSIPVRRL